jgi:hypothetical protein
LGVDWNEYERDSEILLENLIPKEKEKLRHILDRLENVALFDGIYKKNDIYTRDELIKFKKMNSIEYSIKKVDDYYQLGNFRLPVCSFEPSIFYDKYKLNELSNKIPNDRVIFDVGALCGDSTLILNEMFPNHKIYAFEPILNNYNNIFKTIELNQLNNVIPTNLALANETGEREFEYGGRNLCRVDTLDNFVSVNNLKVGLIKTDIEGGEWDMLLGAEKTIKEQKPTLILSVYHNYRDFFKIKPLIESWNLGYRFSWTDSCYGVCPIHEITLNCEVY